MRKKRVSAVAGLCGGQKVGEMEKSGGGSGLFVCFLPRLGTVSSGLGEGEEKVWFFSFAEGQCAAASLEMI
jgi:hypothetical protein